jgi:hypothetical protein
MFEIAENGNQRGNSKRQEIYILKNCIIVSIQFNNSGASQKRDQWHYFPFVLLYVILYVILLLNELAFTTKVYKGLH